MTYDEAMLSPNLTRADKLFVTYGRHPERLSQGVFSVIDAFFHAEGDLRAGLAKGLPDYNDAFVRYRAGALEVQA